MRHSAPELARLAERGTILRCRVGSEAFGTSVSGQGDRDEMGVCVEPPEYVIGLKTFEQYQFRSAREGARSGPGDLDLTIYSLRKWLRLALDGNPTLLTPLYTSEALLLISSPLGEELRANAARVVSRQAGRRFLGYLHAQRERLLGMRGGTDVNRTDLIEAYGFDTKFAGHMVRLGVQGVELLETGKLTLPMPEPWRSWVVALRRGEHSKEEALAVAADLERQLQQLLETSDLPPHPDVTWANEFLVRAYQEVWRQAGSLPPA